MKSAISARKKASRKKKQAGETVPVDDIDWNRVGETMGKISADCKERYAYLCQSSANRGPVPWTRDEDKQILTLVKDHGTYDIKGIDRISFQRIVCRERPFPSYVVSYFLLFLIYQGQKNGVRLPQELTEDRVSSAVSDGIIT